MWYDTDPQRRQLVCDLLWRPPIDVVPFVFMATDAASAALGAVAPEVVAAVTPAVVAATVVEGGAGGSGAGAGSSAPAPLVAVESADAALARVLAGIKHDDKTITECSATVVFGAQNECFYNKVQVINRDLSILAIKVFDKWRRRDMKPRVMKQDYVAKLEEEGKKFPGHFPADLQPRGLIILEALSATGLRSIRYCKEIPGLERVLCNDIDAAAVASIKHNATLNGIDPKVLVPNQGDASLVMYMARSKQFDVVDLDPYGTAAPFLDAGVQAVKEGGLLCVTCTDLAVLCGNHQEACHGKYGSVPLHSRFCHENALRILLACIDRHANTYGRYIVPLVSIQVDFYIRVFVRVFTSAEMVKQSSTKLSYVYQCCTCQSFHLQPVAISAGSDPRHFKPAPPRGPVVSTTCAECGGAFKMGGPIWNAPIHDPEFVQEMVAEAGAGMASHPTALPKCDAGSNDQATVERSRQRMVGILKSIAAELPNAPLYYSLAALSSVIKARQPSTNVFLSGLVNLGYNVSQSHVKPDFVKTDAPASAVWDVLRSWERTTPVAPVHRDNPTHAAYTILRKPVAKEVSFEMSDAVRSRIKGNWLGNPGENWGPKSRAGVKLAPAVPQASRRKERPPYTGPGARGGPKSGGAGAGAGAASGAEEAVDEERGDGEGVNAEEVNAEEGEGVEEGATDGAASDGSRKRTRVEGGAAL